MMNRPILLPTNRDVQANADPRWPVAFASIVLISMVLVAVLALVGWPRLRSISLHYDLLSLRAEVEELRLNEHAIEAEVELLRAPQSIAPQAAEMGLVHPSPEIVDTLSEGARQ
jgi:cell division protein FtsB